MLTYLSPLPLLPYFPVTYLLLSSLYILCSRWPPKRGRAEAGSPSQGENESFIDDDAGDDVDRDTAAVAFNNSIYTVAQHVYHYYNHLVVN